MGVRQCWDGGLCYQDRGPSGLGLEGPKTLSSKTTRFRRLSKGQACHVAHVHENFSEGVSRQAYKGSRRSYEPAPRPPASQCPEHLGAESPGPGPGLINSQPYTATCH
jgi:hypothetical protein